jgi:hypothetical protein
MSLNATMSMAETKTEASTPVGYPDPNELKARIKVGAMAKEKVIRDAFFKVMNAAIAKGFETMCNEGMSNVILEIAKCDLSIGDYRYHHFISAQMRFEQLPTGTLTQELIREMDKSMGASYLLSVNLNGTVTLTVK